jgi:hypothetical protein
VRRFGRWPKAALLKPQKRNCSISKNTHDAYGANPKQGNVIPNATLDGNNRNHALGIHKGLTKQTKANGLDAGLTSKR